ncbi:MAG: aminotransferase class I/II-fold pyridoxal phosphate-dependent enzyme, partial [Deltaproteobacteria bacterium]|nr:aminotransferase class I/II-fold pyridoxal phosphate-dependent enzyme [Deltaproteobacteria bacterium]
LARILSPGKFAVVGPAFAEYEESLLAAGNPPERVFAKEEKDFLVDREVAAEALEKRPAAVIVANPANPTGRLVPDETLDFLIERSEKDGFALIVDEAFIDFTKGRSLEKKVLTNPKLLILRSLTKIHAIPGLRLAYLAGHPETVGGFKAIQEPWPINGMALEAGLHCLRGAEARGRETRAAVEKLKERLVGILSPLGRLFPSDANFVLFKTGGKEARELLAGLYREGILVRDASNFKGLGEGFLRFAVRPEPELARLEEALGDLRARTS